MCQWRSGLFKTTHETVGTQRGNQSPGWFIYLPPLANVNGIVDLPKWHMR